MATTDAYGQGVKIAALTDAPDAATMAQNIVNAVVPQMIMRFQSASERNTTIPVPVAGMMAWLDTEQLLTQYDGKTWSVVAAGSQAWTTVPLTSDWGHNGNSQGTFQYRLVNLFGQPTIMLQGGISRDTAYPVNIPSYFVLNSTLLPPAARPTTLKTLTVTCSDVDSDRIALKLDIRPEGEMRLYGLKSTAQPPWVSFNGCFCSL